MKAVTDNAALRQLGEAEIAEQQARTQLETARNAAERQKAEAEKAEAEAQKAEAEATNSGQAARNAELKARSEAASLKYEAEIRRSKAISELEAARVAARRFKAEADALEQKNLLKATVLADNVREWGLSRCPGTAISTRFTPSKKGAADDRGTIIPDLARFTGGASRNRWAQLFLAISRCWNFTITEPFRPSSAHRRASRPVR